MRENKHTKGEWTVRKSGKGKFGTEFTIVSKTPKCDKCGISDGERHIAKTLSSATGLIQAEANARLISQSPALLEALQGTISMIEELDPNIKYSSAYSAYINAKQVISKAIGE